MGESGPSAGYTGPPPTSGAGAGGFGAGWDPNAMMQTWQGYTPAQQQPWLDAYRAGTPVDQQQWLDYLGQSDPTGGVNNPNYVAPAAPPTRPQYPGTPVDPTLPTPDPVNAPGTLAPTPGVGAEGGNPWDDLSSPRFTNWFQAERAAGRSPGLHFTGQDPTSQYGTFNSQAEQATLMAEFQKLPPEVQAAYVAEYMKLTPQEQQTWRNAFGADNAPAAAGGEAEMYTGQASRSYVPATGNNDPNSRYDPMNQPVMGWQPRPPGQPYQWGVITAPTPRIG